LNTIFEIIANCHFPKNEKELKLLLKKQNISLSVGSTNCNVFSEFPPELLNKSAIITSIGINNKSETDIFSYYFTESLKQKHINHIVFPYIGNNPISLVFVSSSNPEKVLASFLGISGKLDKVSDIEAEYIYIDAYELNKDQISILIDNIIQTGKYKIILGLGNESLLAGKLLEQIKKYLIQGQIHVLTGNSDEFYKLYPFSNINDIAKSNIFSKVSHMLITQGSNGMYGFINGKMHYQKAIEINNIISTSGAGDAAAGAFVAGIILNNSGEQILSKAALAAFNILNKNS
jgi:sugar/nucleoside kinase (ribokinase family)